jgi:transcriptional regulator of acetoin/glycerol metabolism
MPRLEVLGDDHVDVTTTLSDVDSCADPQTTPGFVWFGASSSALRFTRMMGATAIGREPSAQISLHGSAVSRQHAEVKQEGPIYTLRDLGSRNGTFVNGAGIEHAVLSRGDLVRVGDWVGLFDFWPADAERFAELAPGLWGGPAFALRLRDAEQAVSAGLSLAITGETGTGKELLARAAHQWSGRRGRFCALNCAAIPEGLAESELFGHRKGAFTGAERAAIGYFRGADGGTLLLDEVSELPPALQAKLLRVLQERAVVPLGEQVPIPVDVQVVCAAQTSLRTMAEAGSFRLDLATRLSGFTLELPPLRKRRGDIVPLFRRALELFGAGPSRPLESKLVECLLLYGWPGNVRELEQVARQLQALHGNEPVLRRSHLPSFVQDVAPAGEADAAAVPSARELTTRRESDQKRLAHALRETGGNVTRAAELLSFSRQRAYRLLRGKS